MLFLGPGVKDEESGAFDFDRWNLGCPYVWLHLGLVERHHRSVPKMFDCLYG
jgi:hypothetical protein